MYRLFGNKALLNQFMKRGPSQVRLSRLSGSLMVASLVFPQSFARSANKVTNNGTGSVLLWTKERMSPVTEPDPQ